MNAQPKMNQISDIQPLMQSQTGQQGIRVRYQTKQINTQLYRAMYIKPGNNKGEVYSDFSDIRIKQERTHCHNCCPSGKYLVQQMKPVQGGLKKESIAEIRKLYSCCRGCCCCPEWCYDKVYEIDDMKKNKIGTLLFPKCHCCYCCYERFFVRDKNDNEIYRFEVPCECCLCLCWTFCCPLCYIKTRCCGGRIKILKTFQMFDKNNQQHDNAFFRFIKAGNFCCCCFCPIERPKLDTVMNFPKGMQKDDYLNLVHASIHINNFIY